ncbi:MAG: PqiC family protein [Deltaproteobacteria bacterium]|nr:PqiC family protein [Deltaproteobacteria bacterium]
MMRTGLSYKIIWLISLTALLFTGCSSSTPKAEFYTLNSINSTRPDATAPPAGQSLSLGIGPVTIPNVLDRPQIVTRTGPNKLQIDEFHRWAGRLDEDVARVVAENLSLLLATEQVAVYPWDVSFKPRYQVILDVQRFEGRMGKGDVLLEVLWKVVDVQNNTTLRMKKSVITEPFTVTDYNTLVAAKSRTIGKLSKVISKEIKHL